MFDQVIKDETYLSFQVIRGEFDHILLKNARKQCSLDARLAKKPHEEATSHHHRRRSGRFCNSPPPSSIGRSTVDYRTGVFSSLSHRRIIERRMRCQLACIKLGTRTPSPEIPNHVQQSTQLCLRQCTHLNATRSLTALTLACRIATLLRLPRQARGPRQWRGQS